MDHDHNSLVKSSLLNEIKNLYQLSCAASKQVLGGFSSLNVPLQGNGKNYVLKKYRAKNERDVTYIETIAKFLQKENLPCFSPILTKNAEDHFFREGAYYALYPKIEGQIYDEPSLDEKRLQSAADLLGKLHSLKLPEGLVKEPKTLSSESLDAFIKAPALQKSCTHNSPSAEILRFIEKSIDQKKALLKDLSDKKVSWNLEGNQLVHGDFHNQNLLFGLKNEIVGLLDFEEVHKGHGLEDVVHFILLGCCNTGFENENLEKAQIFLKNYSSHHLITKKELKVAIYHWIIRNSTSVFMEELLLSTQDPFFIELIKRDRKKVDYLIHEMDSFVEKITDE